MSLRYRNALIPFRFLDDGDRCTDRSFPRSDCSDIYDDRYEAYNLRGRRRRRRYRDDKDSEEAGDIVRSLRDPTRERKGDLGWNLDYATAYCYRHLNGNRPDIITAIDTARKLWVHPKTPFLMFNCLDKALFQNKLKDMVHLKWVRMCGGSPGSTSVPSKEIPRICIRLNRTEFEDGRATIDDMLDVLIHQMIHAYFLVCCGAAPIETKNDDRLLDGVHFAVLLRTIDEISVCCREGRLDLVVYARDRNQGPCGAGGYESRRLAAARQAPYISMDPRDSTIATPPADGRSHCTHDNSRFTKAQVKNWQVVEYAKCIELGMDEKGDIVHDFTEGRNFEEVARLKGDPSHTYVELLWDEYRVMAPRKKVLAFQSLRKPALKDEKHEIKVPECKFMVFRCLYDFIQHSFYAGNDSIPWTSSSTARRKGKGPPKLRDVRTKKEDPDGLGVITHVRVFKTAERLKFVELQEYALARLWDMQSSYDDPIIALKEVYNDDDHDRLIAAKLRDWARGLLKEDGHSRERRALGRRSEDYYQDYRTGTTNYQKIVAEHGEEFKSLYYRNESLKDDCKLVAYELRHPGQLSDEQVLSRGCHRNAASHHFELDDHVHRRHLGNPGLLDIEDPIEVRYSSPAISTISEASTVLLDDLHHHRRLGLRPALARKDTDPDVRPKFLPVADVHEYACFPRYTGRRHGLGSEYTRERWARLYGLD